MSDDDRNDFHKRLARLEGQKRVNLRAKSRTRAGVYDFEEEKRRARLKFPWRRLFVLTFIGIVGMIAVKAYVAKDMGEEAYQARISELSSGDTYQRIAGILISRDPLMILFENTLFRNVTPNVNRDGNKNASDVTSEAS